jgi:superfamily II DNA or RNA helicase
MTNKYAFQNDLISKVLISLSNAQSVILAGCVGSGKTIMSNRIMQKYKKVLVLAHGQDILRTQFAESTRTFTKNVHIIKRSKQFTELRDLKKGVVVSLPQTIKNIKNLGDFDLIVVDEAHHFYLADMCQSILEKQPKAKRLLLTATPFVLRSLNIEEHIFTLDKALDIGIMSNATMEIMTSCYNYNLLDYTQDATLKEAAETKITKKETDQTMGSVLSALVKSVSQKVNKLDKTIIVASSIRQSNYITSFLKKAKIASLVSHSKGDISSENIELFKKDKTLSVLVVVGRARLGFDMPELVNMVDMSGTLNPALLYQMLGRVTRVHPRGKKKRFIKVTPSKLHQYTYATMCITAGLCYEDFFRSYDPDNYYGMPIPREVYGDEFAEDDDSDTQVRKKSLLDLAKTCDIFNKLKYNPNNILDKSAYITLAEIRAKMLGIVRWDYDSAKKEATKYNSLHKWHTKSSGSYGWAEKNKVQRKIAEELGWEPCKLVERWTYEAAKKEATKFSSLGEWDIKSSGSYGWACKNKVQRKIAEELRWKVR